MDISGNMSKYFNAVEKGTRWLLQLQNKDGSYGNGVIELEAYYKSPLAFAETNHVLQGQKVIQWIVEKYRTPAGHFYDSLNDISFQRHCDLYQDLWIIWGAWRLGQFGIAQTGLDFVLRFFDKTSGGFQSSITDDISTARRELRSTALGGLVSLITGNIEVAKAAGEFLAKIIDMQPGPTLGFFLMLDANGKLVTDFPVEEERFFVVTSRQKQPLYYALGLAVAFLAKLSYITHEPQYITIAQKYLSICERYGIEILQHHYSGKLGWGLAMLYNITGEIKYKELAFVVLEYLAELQFPTGEWLLRNLFPNLREQPFVLTIDRTAEFSIWLTYILNELSGKK